MNMKKISALLFMLGIVNVGISQIYLERKDGRVIFDGQSVEAEGTVFVPQEFTKGYVIQNGKKIDIAKMRLNTYDNRLEYQEGEQVKLLHFL
jgi:hypothetical protein